MQNNEIGPSSYTIYKNQLRVDYDLNIKPETTKFLKIEGKLLDTGLNNDFLYIASKKTGNNSKNRHMELNQIKI